VTWSLANGATQAVPAGVATTVDPGTTISNATGRANGTITVSSSQTPGFIIVMATGPAGCFVWRPLHFASNPVGVGLTTVIGPLTTSAADYGAQFENTLNAASGNSAHLFQVKVNERFSTLATPNASTHLVTTPFGDFTLRTNRGPRTRRAWWLSASGVGPQHRHR
jgi:hypothetical protein